MYLVILLGNKSDTYYINEELLLRTHTSAHQNSNLKKLSEHKNDGFCVFGDVYRRDEIDRCHYPAFHQLESVMMYDIDEIKTYIKNNEFILTNENKKEIIQNENYQYFSNISEENLKILYLIVKDLKQTQESLIKHILRDNTIEFRWIQGSFPFTEPSYELEIKYEGDWLEMFGCGIIHQDVLENALINKDKKIGWASGIGIERYAMLLHKINDIRYFWSEDERFINQFLKNKNSIFKPYSKYPFCYKDISIYYPIDEDYDRNYIHDVARNFGGDLIEKIDLIDTFENKKINKISRCFRIFYRSLDRTLKNEEIDNIQFAIRDNLQKNNFILR